MKSPVAALTSVLLLSACRDVDVRRTGAQDPPFDPGRAPLGPVRAVAVATDRTCAIDEAGSVLCWGLDLLSPDWGAANLAPVRVEGVDGATEIALSESYACATSASGIQCWGTVPWATLGAPKTSPELLANSSNARGLTVAQGRVCAIVGETSAGTNPGVVGRVRCWGTASDPEACFSGGQPATADGFDIPGVDDATTVQASGGATCFTRATGAPRCWIVGANEEPEAMVDLALPGATSLAISQSDGCYSAHALYCGVLPDGAVDCLEGLGTEVDEPVLHVYDGKPAAARVVWADPLAETTCVLTESGALRCGGADVLSADDVAFASSHACAIVGGDLRCWGSNEGGALGLGIPARRSEARPVAGLSDVVSLDAGADHTCATRDNGEVVCWGSNAAAQRGWTSSPVEATYHPRWAWYADEVSELPRAVDGVSPASGVFAEQYRTCASTLDGGVTCWGQDLTQRLSLATPTVIAGVSAAIDVAPGDDSESCAVQADGGVSCWGRGWYGTRVGVEHLALPGPAVAVDGDTYDACALLADGEVYCWGGHVEGSIGAEGDPLAPKKRVGVEDAIDLSGSCVVTGAHDLVCWAFPWNGELVQNGAPTVIATGVRDVDGPCVVRDDGTVACFADFGAIDPTIAEPKTVPGLSDATKVAAGARHACALRTDATVVCWGWASGGRLGDGSATVFPHPVSVDAPW
ncbi:MAG: hypothetical protein U0414_33760 [Polyangiaceae bacterium]